MRNATLAVVLGLIMMGCGAKGPEQPDGGGPSPDLGGMMAPDGGMPCTATNTAANCGACGNACPGVGLDNCDAVCADPGSKRCDLTCRGEDYDVDKDPGNGCEQLHTGPGHTRATALDRGHKSCSDSSSKDDITDSMFSDARVHTNPEVDDFSGTLGTAPDFFKVEADGGLTCVDDYSVTFTTTGGGSTMCYKCSIITDNLTDSVTVTGAGSATMSGGKSSYSDGSVIYFKVEKICPLPIQEAVSYKISYHL